MYVMLINQITKTLDIIIIISFIFSLLMTLHFNLTKNGPKTLAVLMQKRRFQAIGFFMIAVQIGKTMILVFGTLYYSA
jgi:hypothetical protein